MFDSVLAKNRIFVTEARWEEIPREIINIDRKTELKDCSEAYVYTWCVNSLHARKTMFTRQQTSKVLEEWGKPEYPEKNLSEQSREPTNSAHL